MCTNFQTKRKALNFWAQICPKMDFGLKFQKSKSGCEISILEILRPPTLRQNRKLWNFGPKFTQKLILGSEFQKSKSGFGISISIIPCVLIFSQNGQFLSFRHKLGKLPNYVQYFGSNIVEDVAESWVEAGMSWMEVDGAGWRLKWAGWRWMELGRGGCTV